MKRVVFASVISLVIIGLIVVGYFYYQQIKMPRSEGVNAIPHDAALIIETRDPGGLLKKLSANMMWQGIAESQMFRGMNANAGFLDSLIDANEKISTYLKSNPLFISAHVIKANDFDYLYVITLPKIGQEAFVTDALNVIAGENISPSKRVYEGINIKEFKTRDRKAFTYTIHKGLFIGSFTAFLVEDAIRQLKSSFPRTGEPTFISVYDAAGKKVDANVYLNYPNLSKLLSTFSTMQGREALSTFAAFGNWSGLDFKLKPSSFSLNGFSSVLDTAKFLNVMTDQKPQQLDMIKVLPKRTAVLVYAAMSDFESYYKKYRNFLPKSNRNIIKMLDHDLKLSVEEKFVSWVDNEYALLVTEPNSTNYNNNCYAIFRARDVMNARNSLRELAEAAARSKKTGPPQEEVYRDHQIGFISLSSIIPLLFGKTFEKIEKLYFTSINDYIIFGNQASGLRGLIDDFESQKLLFTDPRFNSISEGFSAKTNGFYYVNVPRSMQVLKSYASDDFLKTIEKNLDYFKKFDAITYQFSSEGKLFYTNFYMQYNVITKSDANILWSSTIDTTISMTPTLVLHPKTKRKEIIVQDDANRLHLVDESGESIWKIQLTEKIISRIYEIDYYKNGKLQFLFNTASSIYLVDRRSDFVSNYPIRLPAMATSEMAVFDYDNNRDYRYFIACDNNVVYAYTPSGKPVTGWSFNVKTGKLNEPVSHIVSGDKDFLVFYDDLGGVFVLDRKGNVKVEYGTKFNTAFTTPLLYDSGGNGNLPRLLTTDASGKVYSFYLNGQVKVSRIRELSANHRFVFGDVNGDGEKDYIFLDNNQLWVYNADSTVIFTYPFEKEISHGPVLYPMPDGKSRIGLTSAANNEIYLVNPDGTLHDGFPLKGSTGFIIEDMNNDGKMNIVVGSNDRSIYVYTIE